MRDLAKVDRLVASCEKLCRAFEDGWPSHVTHSIGGTGHAIGTPECAACQMLVAYEEAMQELAALKALGVEVGDE